MERLWLDLTLAALGGVGLVGVLKTKEPGFGPKTNQALIAVLVIPATVILGVEKILDSQAIAAIIGGMVGFGAAKSMKD